MIDISFYDGLPYTFDNMAAEVSGKERQPKKGANKDVDAPVADQEAEVSDIVAHKEPSLPTDPEAQGKGNDAFDGSKEDPPTTSDPQS